jgi:hypothetical protein
MHVLWNKWDVIFQTFKCIIDGYGIPGNLLETDTKVILTSKILFAYYFLYRKKLTCSVEQHPSSLSQYGNPRVL